LKSSWARASTCVLSANRRDTAAGLTRDISTARMAGMSMAVIGGGVLGFVLLYLVIARAMRGGSKSRRARELKGGPQQFHWGMIGAYMGKADPTALQANAAADILRNGWSCKEVEALRRKMTKYRTGELNHAFDAARIAWLAELARSAGWFTGEELADWSTAASQRVRGAYRSWQDYEAAVLEGWQRWWPEVARSPMPADDQQRMARVRSESKPLLASIPWA